ncbi:unnamed protein product [Prorocentrum cordatum]|uniref:Uncharacterized protein n=1 Tax=Prorocentrum cordatum TaxID=2364126 RepID=A0ABN9T2Z5_9DINO|nr:unnamed protein product [Polarella glacialis]
MKSARGSGWNACNRICEEKEKQRIAQAHKQAVDEIYARPRRQGTSLPMDPPREYSHVSGPSQAKKVNVVRKSDVDFENRALVQKLLQIDVRPNQLAQAASARLSEHATPRSLSTVAKRRENERIEQANAKMLERINGMRTATERRRRHEEQREMERQVLSARVSENANRVRMWHLPRPVPRPTKTSTFFDEPAMTSTSLFSRTSLPLQERSSTAPLPLEDSAWSPLGSTFQDPTGPGTRTPWRCPDAGRARAGAPRRFFAGAPAGGAPEPRRPAGCAGGPAVMGDKPRTTTPSTSFSQ